MKIGKSKIILIIMITIIVIILTLGLIINLFTKKDNIVEHGPKKEIIEGNCQIITTGEKLWQYSEGKHMPYLKCKINNKTVYLDTLGNVVYEGDDSFTYLGENYILAEKNNKQNILKNNKLIYSYSGRGNTLNSGKLYYCTGIGENAQVVCYDLEENKELWTVKCIDAGNEINVYDNFIVCGKSISAKIGGYNVYTQQIMKKDGSVIAESSISEIIYGTATEYYFKYKENEYLEVYDFDNNKISYQSLVNENLQKLLPNGMYITENKEGDTYFYNLYNKEAKKILKTNGILKIVIDKAPDYIVLEASSRYIIIHSDETMKIEQFEDVHKSYIASNCCLDISEGNFLYGRENYDDIVHDEYKVLNLLSREVMTINNKITRILESPNKKYAIINNMVYDYDFNKLYETEGSEIYMVNDEYVVEKISNSEKKKDELYLINVFNRDKKLLDTQGYCYFVEGRLIGTAKELYAENTEKTVYVIK